MKKRSRVIMKNEKTIAVIPGSYDPITNGHLDIINRASLMFNEVIVLLCVNSAKRGFVDVSVRKSLCEDAVANLSNVKVDVCGGLFADYCQEKGINVIVKGIRNFTDYSYETELKQYNDRIFAEKYATTPETVFLPSSQELSFCSSTFVREMLKYNENVEKYVPNSDLLLKLINLP